jgi:hypothetical protein
MEEQWGRRGLTWFSKNGVFISSIVRNYLQVIREVETVLQNMLMESGRNESENRAEWNFNRGYGPYAESESEFFPTVRNLYSVFLKR